MLDKLVEELGKDPLAIAAYVHNEIGFVDPILYEEKDVFYAPGIQKNIYVTFYEREGSPWEQCQLLVYLLRQAGCQAAYATDAICSLPKSFAEKLFGVRFSEEQSEVLVQYPWVLLFDGENQIPLFPWMKEMQVDEGYDLYSLMPDEYSSADRWIARYLKGDKEILKHIGPDGNDTAAVLFARFIEEKLREQGLSLSDVGVHRKLIKRQFHSWDDFPRPEIQGNYQILHNLERSSKLFASARIDVSSRENPQKKLQPILMWPAEHPNAHLPIYFSHLVSRFGNKEHVHVGPGFATTLSLDDSDRHIDIKISYQLPLRNGVYGQFSKTFSIVKNTRSVLRFHLGGSSPTLTSQFHKAFSSSQHPWERIDRLLALTGRTYFERCCQGEATLAKLHKITPSTVCSFGLCSLAPRLSQNSASKSMEQLPQVDMFSLSANRLSKGSYIGNDEYQYARRQYLSLCMVDYSSNEHQVLQDIFEDPNAISTVKLLQLAQKRQRKSDDSKEGFLALTTPRVETVEKAPANAKRLYFSHLNGFDPSTIQAASSGQWNTVKEVLKREDHLSDWAYAYMTPGLVSSQNRTYHEAGTLIFHPSKLHALISSNHLVLNGGLGSPLPKHYFTPQAIKQWRLTPHDNHYSLKVSPAPEPKFSSATKKWAADVRPGHKSFTNTVADPVDVVTGTFYLDEADLVLPGPFPLEIRRNYNSQNPLIGDFGCGWKLNLNPFLIKQDGKLYAAEADGTVIVYRFDSKVSRWIVFPEDNPDLWNFNRRGIGGVANPFHAYIENNTLYGSDGSKRIFEDGLLKKWINAKGASLTFSYDKGRLSRIESSSGSYCGLHYNHEGKVSEIYAKDGRRIYYSYNSTGDLVKVALPNTATVAYEYDESHCIIRETKPHGQVLENTYDNQGRVVEQRSPMGLQQEMITSTTFAYEDGCTIVTDAGGGQTTYQIFEKQIYKVTDPLGHQTLQSWFVDEKTWFDPQTGKLATWNQPGGALRSLKSSKNKRGLTTYYRYDSKGNPVEIGIKGKDLTGGGESLITKKLTYNFQNLCVQEDVSQQKVVTSYDSKFPFLKKRIEQYHDGHLISYTDLKYNKLGQVVKEDHSGSVTLWKYDKRGFPIQRTQKTGTDDPDVITTYSFNDQGQCVRQTTANGVIENDYDMMGNLIQSKLYSSSRALLSASYVGYDLNNNPIWKQTANSNNTVYFDYHASGRIKAMRQTLSPENAVAYTLFEYDSRGNLIEHIDPLGHCIYREYDALGRIKSERTDRLKSNFTYESGGLIDTMSSPSGAKTTHTYTTNGLLKEKTHPDGTIDSVVYDVYGRPIRETKNGITWEIKYDGPHRIICTHLATQIKEIREFDANGNLIRFTDAAGNISEKSYDGLGRLTSETSCGGEKTTWGYQGNIVSCTLPNGEKTAQYYEGNRVVETKVWDPKGKLIARTTVHYNPETDKEEVVQGDKVTTTWRTTLGLPIKVQTGDIVTTYKYDHGGNCIASIDGEGRTTFQTFDPVGRVVQKKLPDGSQINYAYDKDSNLIECRFPNGAIWKASYDLMGRKCIEELQAKGAVSQHWEYAYEEGLLKATKDPARRTHEYQYDTFGRLVKESVEGWNRAYTYNSQGLLASMEQENSHGAWLSGQKLRNEHSRIERSYDSDGRLILESIYLNSVLQQQTHQTWSPSGRSLQIDRHQRAFAYQNNQLVSVSTQGADLSYTYSLSGALKSKQTPSSTTTINYKASSLPEKMHTRLPKESYQESLEWDKSGKLSLYQSPKQQKRFTYNAKGYLQSVGQEKYQFDFGELGTGILTDSSNSRVPKNGLDSFGKITNEIRNEKALSISYDRMGQISSQDQAQFEWDPWGGLLKVATGTYTWEASYDALGRRLQAHYTPTDSSTQTTTSLYDPEEEFQEIGVKYGEKTFWKIYGPTSCDAITDEAGTAVYLVHNALGQLAGVVSQKETIYNSQLPSVYGPQHTPSPVGSDLLSYAQALTWHSKAQDPTGLIWLGARYYDPKGRRFISPDPVRYPITLDPYVYAGGDPVNYFDPDGRFFSSAYQTTAPVVMGVIRNPQFQGSLQMTFGAIEVGAGLFAIAASGGSATPLGLVAVVHGLDNVTTGAIAGFTGRPRETVTSQSLQYAGMSPNAAHLTDAGMSIAFTMGSVGIVQSSRTVAVGTMRLPTARAFPVRNYKGWTLPKNGGGAKINGRWYTEHALERMAPRTPRVMAELETRFVPRAESMSVKLPPKAYKKWYYKNAPNPRGIPPSVIEAEIANPGSTGVKVMLNELGEVVTVYPKGFNGS